MSNISLISDNKSPEKGSQPLSPMRELYCTYRGRGLSPNMASRLIRDAMNETWYGLKASQRSAVIAEGTRMEARQDVKDRISYLVEKRAEEVSASLPTLLISRGMEVLNEVIERSLANGDLDVATRAVKVMLGCVLGPNQALQGQELYNAISLVREGD